MLRKLLIIFTWIIMTLLMIWCIYLISTDRYDMRNRHKMDQKILREYQENLATEHNDNPGSKITMDSIK